MADAAAGPHSSRAPEVYVASPLGFTEAGRRYLGGVLHPRLLSAGLVVLDPWEDPEGRFAALLGATRTPLRDVALQELNAATGARNAALIARASAVLAVLDGAELDSGTAAEVGYAAALERPVVALRTDTRLSADNDQAFVNLQVEYFVLASGGALCRDLEDAVTQLLARLG